MLQYFCNQIEFGYHSPSPASWSKEGLSAYRSCPLHSVSHSSWNDAKSLPLISVTLLDRPPSLRSRSNWTTKVFQVSPLTIDVSFTDDQIKTKISNLIELKRSANPTRPRDPYDVATFTSPWSYRDGPDISLSPPSRRYFRFALYEHRMAMHRISNVHHSLLLLILAAFVARCCILLSSRPTRGSRPNRVMKAVSPLMRAS